MKDIKKRLFLILLFTSILYIVLISIIEKSFNPYILISSVIFGCLVYSLYFLLVKLNAIYNKIRKR